LNQYSDIFGQCSLKVKTQDGCPLSHYITHVASWRFQDLELDWRDVDNNGRNALQCISHRLVDRRLLKSLLSTLYANSTEVATNLTADIIGGIKLITSSVAANDLINQIVALVPKSKWQELVTDSIQLLIRNNGSGLLVSAFLNYRKNDEATGKHSIREYAQQALFEPFDHSKWANFYSHNTNAQRRMFLSAPQALIHYTPQTDTDDDESTLIQNRVAIMFLNEARHRVAANPKQRVAWNVAADFFGFTSPTLMSTVTQTASSAYEAVKGKVMGWFKPAM